MTTPGPLARWKSLAKIRIQLRVEDFEDLPPPDNTPIPNAGAEAFGIGQQHMASALNESNGFDIVPYTYSVERNSYRKADECRATFPLRDMPFDPRVLRAATIQIFAGVVDPTVWALAMDSPDAQGVVIPDKNADRTSNEIFRGFVDDWEMTLGEHDMIEITARDLTSFFIDAELPQNALRNIPKATRLDDVIRLLIFGDGLPEGLSKRPGLPGVKGTTVVNDTNEQLPKLGDIKPPNWFDSKQLVKKGRKRSKQNVQKMAYWDMMTDLCVSAGFICYVRPVLVSDAQSVAEVVISNPRTYYAKSAANGEQIVPERMIRQFIYGININELEIRRNFAGAAIPTVIEVRAFDAATGKEFSSRFPAKRKNNRPAVSGKGDREDIQVFIMRSQGSEGVQAVLDRAAESIYEQLSRGEFEVKIRTKTLAALPQNVIPQIVPPESSNVPPQLDADIFRMQSGEPISVRIDTSDLTRDVDGRVAQHTLLAGLAPAAQSEEMVRRGIRKDVADQIAQAGTSQYVQTEYRTQKLIMNYDKDRGHEFEIHAINYLDIRNSALNELPAPVPPTSGPTPLPDV